MSRERQETYEFGDFRIDAADRQLRSGDEVVHLEPKSFDALVFLASNAGRLVTKQEIVDAVWARAAVTDNSLTRCIHQVRTALDDHADEPLYIETVPGSGYRFVADVKTSAGHEVPPAWRLAAAKPLLFAAMVLVAGGLWYFQPPETPRIERLAVLPFVNLTGEERQDYFVRGIHDALIAELSRIAEIDVISRTSVMGFVDTTRNMDDIARQLDVDAVVEGSVLRVDDTMTVTAQLIALAPERHLWADRYHRDVGELFAMTTEIVEAITKEIAVELSAEPAGMGPSVGNAQAFSELLAGRFQFEQRTPEGYRAAKDHFRRAIELDPELAPAWVGLAHVDASAAIFGMRKPGETFPETKRLAQKALDLDPRLPEAHLLLAGVAFYWERDWAEAERQARYALTLRPSFANVYRLLSEIYSVTGRHAAALAAVERGRELDPLPPTAQFKPAYILYLARDYEAAIERARQALEHYPTFWQGHWLMCMAEAALRHLDAARSACKAAAQYSNNVPIVNATLGYVAALSGDQSAATAVATSLESERQAHYVGAAGIALVYGALGDNDTAFRFLEAAVADRDQQLLHAENDALFDDLRRDARFTALQSGTAQP